MGADVVEERERAIDARRAGSSAQTSNACVGLEAGIGRRRGRRRRSRGARPSTSSRSALRASASQRSARGSSTMRSRSQSRREPVADDAEHRGDVARPSGPWRVGELGDVERGRAARSSAATRAASSAGTPRVDERARSPASSRSRSLPAQQLGQHVGEPVDAAAANDVDGRARPGAAAAVAQEPAARPLDELAGLEVHRGLHVDADDAVERLDVAPQRLLAERSPAPLRARARCRRRSRRSPRRAGTRTSCRPGSPCRSRARSRRSRAAAGASRMRSRKRSRSAVREVAHELGHEVGVVGQRGTRAALLRA